MKNPCPLCIDKSEFDRPSEGAPKQSLRRLIEERPAIPPFKGEGPQVHVWCFKRSRGASVPDLIKQTIADEQAPKQTTPAPGPATWTPIGQIHNAT